MTTPTPNRNEAAEYNYPSIEHNGEQWIRVVDHINLTEIERQQAVAEFAREVVALPVRYEIVSGSRNMKDGRATPFINKESIRTLAKQRGIELN